MPPGPIAPGGATSSVVRASPLRRPAEPVTSTPSTASADRLRRVIVTSYAVGPPSDERSQPPNPVGARSAATVTVSARSIGGGPATGATGWPTSVILATATSPLSGLATRTRHGHGAGGAVTGI